MVAAAVGGVKNSFSGSAVTAGEQWARSNSGSVAVVGGDNGPKVDRRCCES